jgi:4-oxalocrotonate tautomerase
MFKQVICVVIMLVRHKEIIMPIIRVEMFKGRDLDTRRAIIKELTDGFCRATGAKPDVVDVVLVDVDQQDWGKGGIAFADQKPD